MLLTLCLLNYNTAYGKFEFYKNNQILRKASRERLTRFIAEREIKIFEPQTQKELTMKGHDFKTVMDKIYGPSWKNAKSLLVTCKDGYQPVIQIETLITGNPFLVYEIVNYPSFAFKKADKEILLGPAYLVWSDTFTQPELLKHLGQGNWPYQITRFNLLTK